MNAKDSDKDLELERLRREVERLSRENDNLTEEVDHLKRRLRNAKDPTPIERVSFRRLVEAARQACLTVSRQKGKVIISLGHLKRVFKSLKEAWAFLSQEEWLLEELFPPTPKKPSSYKACRFCRKPISWLEKKLNKWIPLNPDGSRHRCKKDEQQTLNSQPLATPF